jgi:hypothetical protein
VRSRPNLLNKRFEARWLLEDDCETIVNSAWQEATNRGAANTMDFLKAVSKDLHTWSRDVLGDLQQRIKKIRSELEELRRGVISEIQVISMPLQQRGKRKTRLKNSKGKMV